jgi:type IV pilus assembly protein PilO
MALPASLQSFVDGPRLPKIALGVVVLLLLGVGSYLLVLSPLADEVTALDAQNATLQRELIQNRAIVAELDRFRLELAELQKKLAVLKEKLPTEKETPPLYRTIQDAAAQAGLAVSLFQPRDPRPQDYYHEIPIIVTAEGGYHDLGDFLGRVARLPRVVNLAELRATGLVKSRNSLRAELTLATYMYRAEGAAPKPGTPAPKPPAGTAPAPKPPGAKP